MSEVAVSSKKPQELAECAVNRGHGQLFSGAKTDGAFKPDGKTCHVWIRRTAVVLVVLLVVVKVVVVPVKVEFSAVQFSIKMKLLLPLSLFV